MIDFKNKIIFVHVYKVAGISISRSLERNPFPKLINNNEYLYYHYKKRFKNKNIVYENEYISKHSKAIEYKNYFKDDYKQYFKFAFVRNPYDWQVSLYSYMQQHENHPQHQIVKNMDFNNYLIWRCSEDKNYQYEYLVDEKNNFIVDFIGKFENLDRDIKVLEEKLEFKFNLPFTNKSIRKNYKDYYDEKNKELIFKNFKKDFEILNYDSYL